MNYGDFTIGFEQGQEHEKGYADAKKEYEDKMGQIRAKTEWIPVSERLPKDHDWYLIVVKEKSTGYQYIPRVASHLHNNDWCLIDTEDADKDWLDDLECIAWMPLPEPYKSQNCLKFNQDVDIPSSVTNAKWMFASIRK